MKTQVNLTAGKWEGEILNALRYAFDKENSGYTVTLEQSIGYPIRIFGLAKPVPGSTDVRVYIQGCQSTILLKNDDKVFINHI